MSGEDEVGGRIHHCLQTAELSRRQTREYKVKVVQSARAKGATSPEKTSRLSDRRIDRS
jgi:hypothetical protein